MIKLNKQAAFAVGFFALLDAISIENNFNFYKIFIQIPNLAKLPVGISTFALAAFSYVITAVFALALLSFAIDLLAPTTKRKNIFTVLIVANALLFLYVRNPQIFHSIWKLDRLYSHFGVPESLYVFYFANAALIGYSIYLMSFDLEKITKWLALMAVIFWIGEKSYILFDCELFSGHNYGTIEESKAIVVISLDSLNENMLGTIKKYANAPLAEYLKQATEYTNIIADVTQTHGSFSSIFSGKQSFELRNRFPLSNVFLASEQSNLKTLNELKAQNYKVIVARDEMDTSRQESGSAIDQINFKFQNIPQNVLINRLFSGYLVFGLAPAILTHFTFPFVYDNAIQSYGFNPRKYAEFASQVIQRELSDPADPRNKFFFLHTCTLHLPLKLPFGYYPENAAPNDGGEAVSYNDPVNSLAPEYKFEKTKERAEYDNLIYGLGVKYITEKFLNPLFNRLNSMGLLSRATIMVIADHGESLWGNRQYYPQRNSYVFHGDNDLYGSLAQRPLFLSNSGHPKDQIVDHRLLNLSQVFRKELGLNYAGEVYSENAFGLSPEPPDLFSTYSWKHMISRIKSTSGLIYLGDEFEKPSILFKQKTVFIEDYKLSLYRTINGRQLILCKFKADQECAENLWNNRLNRTQLWIDRINAVLKPDVDNNLDIPVKVDREFNIDQNAELITQLSSQNEWLKLYGSFVATSLTRNFIPIQKLIEDNQKKTEPDLFKDVLEDLAVKYCGSKTCSNPGTLMSLDTQADVLKNLNSLPKLIYSGEINAKFSTENTLSLDNMSDILAGLPLARRLVFVDELSKILDRVFYYSKEHHLTLAEANYWKLKFLFFKSVEKQNFVVDELIQRMSLFQQHLPLEAAVAGMNAVSTKLGDSTCRNIKKIIGMANSTGNLYRLKLWAESDLTRACGS